MNKHYRTLELDRVLEMLAEQATCAASKELALRLKPCDNYRDAADALQRTADINTLTNRYGTPVWAAYRIAPAPCSGPSWVPGYLPGRSCRWRGYCTPSVPSKNGAGREKPLPPPMIYSTCWPR